MTYIAGDRAVARELRKLQPSYAFLAGNVAIEFNDVLTDVPGLTIPVRPNTRYILDGYLAYSSGSTPDIKVSLHGPTGATGRYGMFGVAQTGAASGNQDGFLTVNIGDAIGMAGSGGAMFCQPHGQLRTSDLPGVFQMKFAQVTATASATVLAAGTWLRLTRLPDALQP
jgi:hypothetical protein